MNLKKLQEAIKSYKRYLESEENYEYLFLWEGQKSWQEQWDITELDLLKMYDRSLQNETSRRLWFTKDYEPKYFVEQMFGFQKDFMFQCFKDLFNEDKEVGGRVERFSFYCEELLNAYRKNNPNSKLNDHYHADYRMISLYLAYEYPEQYTYYSLEVFQKLLTHLNARDIPKVHDIARYFKVMNIIKNFMDKDEAIWDLHLQRLNPEIHYMDKSLLLAFEMALITMNIKI